MALYGDERLTSPDHPLAYFNGPQDLLDFLDAYIQQMHGLSADKVAFTRVHQYLLACFHAMSAAPVVQAGAIGGGYSNGAPAGQVALIGTQVGPTILRRSTAASGNRWKSPR